MKEEIIADGESIAVSAKRDSCVYQNCVFLHEDHHAEEKQPCRNELIAILSASIVTFASLTIIAIAVVALAHHESEEMKLDSVMEIESQADRFESLSDLQRLMLDV